MNGLRSAYQGGNRFLDRLSPSLRDEFRAQIFVERRASGEVSQKDDAKQPLVEFPIDAVISIVARMLDGALCEVGMVGNEGAVGIEAAFGAASLRIAICQVQGRVAVIRRDHFLNVIDKNREFERLSGRILQAQHFFIEQQCVCNALHTVSQRSARWYLMIRDRVGNDRFFVTQDFLSVMLGVRRATVTLAAQSLASLGAIAYQRGHVQIVDVPLLAAASCECYQATKNVFDSSLGPLDEPLSEVRFPESLTAASAS